MARILFVRIGPYAIRTLWKKRQHLFASFEIEPDNTRSQTILCNTMNSTLSRYHNRLDQWNFVVKRSPFKAQSENKNTRTLNVLTSFFSSTSELYFMLLNTISSPNVHDVGFCYVVIFSSTFVSYFINIAYPRNIIFCSPQGATN